MLAGMSNESGLLHTHGAALRAIRKKDRRTAADVARFARISPQTLYNAENGQSNLGPDTLKRVADILNIPVAAITCRCPHGVTSHGPETVGAAA